jgi:hypothetical protein
MKFTFNSEQYGTTCELNFEATHIDQIREMFDQFLRGSGFYIEDEDELSVTADKAEISVRADTWVSLTDEELFNLWGGCLSDTEYARIVEAKLKERNNG